LVGPLLHVGGNALRAHALSVCSTSAASYCDSYCACTCMHHVRALHEYLVCEEQYSHYHPQMYVHCKMSSSKYCAREHHILHEGTYVACTTKAQEEDVLQHQHSVCAQDHHALPMLCEHEQGGILIPTHHCHAEHAMWMCSMREQHHILPSNHRRPGGGWMRRVGSTSCIPAPSSMLHYAYENIYMHCVVAGL
jgi:hypothetical protein